MIFVSMASDVTWFAFFFLGAFLLLGSMGLKYALKRLSTIAEETEYIRAVSPEGQAAQKAKDLQEQVFLFLLPSNVLHFTDVVWCSGLLNLIIVKQTLKKALP